MSELDSQLLDFFKALANEARLKIIGLLAQQPRSVDELAAMLELSAPTVSHHLAQLQKARLVEARAQQYYNVYSLRKDVLEEMARDILSVERLSQVAETVDQDSFTNKVLKDYLVHGRLKTIPSQLKKKEVVIRWLAQKFEPAKKYPEKQVNTILKAYHDDFATLRRELVDMKLMVRKDGVYWRTDQN